MPSTALNQLQGELVELKAALKSNLKVAKGVASELQRRWRDKALQTGVSPTLRLGYVYEEARSSFVALVTCLPALWEAYESTDAQGATGCAAAEYPAPGSVRLGLAAGLPEQEARVLARLFEAEASRLAGRVDALRCLARGGGLEVRLEGLKLGSLDALEPARLVLQVSCKRCQHSGELSVATDSVDMGAKMRDGAFPAEGACIGCHQAWALAFAPRFVHEHSAVIGVLTQAAGCTPMDLLPSLFVGQCGSCSAAAAIRGVQVENAPAPIDPAFVIKEGKPLPNAGTCQHYRHSHRWLRFPCCGQRFACDLCHEEGTDGHEMKWALRMICGYCAKEQPLGERCIACGKRLARSAAGAGTGSRFWEGGEGCRDRTRMDRNDPHKYRNSEVKTSSKKSQRVGSEGKRRLQRGQKKA
ncbi:hypothetical protein WJX81_003810 [Elliptochloris bilobata]|uniref:CHY-type domain-containing protein n=1 Tax=Elliptochloris bilobata TaxID=381761 RepID=A0AAW1RTV4_9CHLO